MASANKSVQQKADPAGTLEARKSVAKQLQEAQECLEAYIRDLTTSRQQPTNAIARIAAAENMKSFLIKCGEILNLGADNSFVDVYINYLVDKIQKPADKSFLKALKAVLHGSPTSDDDVKLIENVLLVINAVFDAYLEDHERESEKPLADCGEVVEALAQCVRLSNEWGENGMAVLLRCFGTNKLLHKLMRFKCREASNVFVEFWQRVAMHLNQLNNRSQTSTTEDSHDQDKLIAVQEKLYGMLMTEKFLWRHSEAPLVCLPVPKYFQVSQHLLTKNGWQAQAAISLALLGNLCQERDINDGTRIALSTGQTSARSLIRKETKTGGLTELWSLLFTSTDEIACEAGVVALFNLITWFGEEAYITCAQENVQVLLALQKMDKKILKYLIGTIESSGNFLQGMAAFLVIVLLRVCSLKIQIPRRDFSAVDLLPQVYSACGHLLGSSLFVCRLMGGRLLWTLLDASPQHVRTRMKTTIPAEKAHDTLRKLIVTLRKLSYTLSAGITGCCPQKPSHIFGQEMTLPPHFIHQDWWNDTLKVLNRSYHGAVMRVDNSYTAEQAGIILKCVDILLSNASDEAAAMLELTIKREDGETDMDGKTACEQAAVAFLQFCNPKTPSWLKSLDDYSVPVEVFQLWQRLYFMFERTEKLNAKMLDLVSQGLKGVFSTQVSSATWDFMFMNIPMLSDSLGSMSETPKAASKAFASYVELFNMIRTMQPPSSLPFSHPLADISGPFGGKQISKRLIHKATKLTAVLSLSRFQPSVSLSIANELVTGAVAVHEAFAETGPTVKEMSGDSKMELFKDLEDRMRIMSHLLSQIPLSYKVFLRDAASERDLQSSSSLIEQSVSPRGGAPANPLDRGQTAGPGSDGEISLPPLLQDGRLRRVINVFQKTLRRLKDLHGGEPRTNNLKEGRNFFEKVCYLAETC